MMQILTNDKQEIMAYVILGSIDGAIEYNGVVPDYFESQFKPKFYVLKNGEIRINPNYIEPSNEVPSQALTQQDEINAHFFKANLDLQLQLEEMKHDG